MTAPLRHQRVVIALSLHILRADVARSSNGRVEGFAVRLTLRCLLKHCSDRWPLELYPDEATLENEIGRAQGVTAAFNGIVRQLRQAGRYEDLSASCYRSLDQCRPEYFKRDMTYLRQRTLRVYNTDRCLAWLRCSRQLAWMRIALFEPEIAGNVGAVLRLGACLGAAVDLIEPMGFEWDDRRVRRTAMDYIDHVAIVRHACFDAFRSTVEHRRLLLFTTKTRQSAYDFDFMADDVLLFGKESAGVPPTIAEDCDARLRIPMRPQVRSMNLATSAALALGEALRQTATLPT